MDGKSKIQLRNWTRAGRVVDYLKSNNINFTQESKTIFAVDTEDIDRIILELKKLGVQPTKLNEGNMNGNKLNESDNGSLVSTILNLYGDWRSFNKAVRDDPYEVTNSINSELGTSYSHNDINDVRESDLNESDDSLTLDAELGDAPITTYADMLVFNSDGKILLLKRNAECEFEPNKWGFPGGKVMPSETTEEGASRETVEECGVKVSGVEKIGEYVNNGGENGVSHYFKGLAENEPALGDEHQEMEWIEPEEISSYDLIMDNVDRYEELVDLSATPAEGVVEIDDDELEIIDKDYNTDIPDIPDGDDSDDDSNDESNLNEEYADQISNAWVEKLLIKHGVEQEDAEDTYEELSANGKYSDIDQVTQAISKYSSEIQEAILTGLDESVIDLKEAAIDDLISDLIAARDEAKVAGNEDEVDRFQEELDKARDQKLEDYKSSVLLKIEEYRNRIEEKEKQLELELDNRDRVKIEGQIQDYKDKIDELETEMAKKIKDSIGGAIDAVDSFLESKTLNECKTLNERKMFLKLRTKKTIKSLSESKKLDFDTILNLINNSGLIRITKLNESSNMELRKHKMVSMILFKINDLNYIDLELVNREIDKYYAR